MSILDTALWETGGAGTGDDRRLWDEYGRQVRPPAATDGPVDAHPQEGRHYPEPPLLVAENVRLRWERDSAWAEADRLRARVAELTRAVEWLGRLIVHAAGHDKAASS